MRPFLVVTLIVCIFFALQNADADECPTEKNQPRIGLVLGGGGARGVAHIGVIKVLEQQRIPIDYVVGTSMGAIVGGAYASGMSPDEIESIISNIDWEEVFNDDAPRTELSFQHKSDDRRFTGLQMGIQNGGLALPRGAIAGRRLEFVLESAFLPVSRIENFDELSIPFRAVATNIESGEPVVINSGSLPSALRASMSIPGAFAPVHIQGYLVDGYVSNNVPINVAKQLGSSLVIAVDVGTPLATRKDLRSLVDILTQVSGIATVKNVSEQIRLLTPEDILITPELKDISVTDFTKISEIVPLGVDAATRQVESLRLHSVTDSQYQQYLACQRRAPSPPEKVDFVRVLPTERVVEERIAAKVTVQPNKPLETEELKDTLDRIYSLGEFETVGFKMIEEDGKNGLVLTASDKPWGPNYLRFGINLSSDLQGDSYYTALLDYIRSSVNKLGAEWRNELQIGRDTGLLSEFYQPLDYSDRFFISPNVEADQKISNIYSDGTRIAEYRRREYLGGLDGGYNFGTAAQLRTGLVWGWLNAEPSTGDVSLPTADENRGAFLTTLAFDQLDDPNFPRHGQALRLRAWLEEEALGAARSYNKYDFDLYSPFSFGQHTITPQVSIGINPGDDAPYYDWYTLGGPRSLAGYRIDELRGRDMLSGQLLYFYKRSENLFSFTKSSYFGLALDWGNAWQKEEDISLTDLVFGGALYAAADTVMGPFYFSLGMNNDRDQVVLYVSFGQRL